MIRRAFDIAVAATVLVFAAPVIAVAAVSVKLSSSGPAFFAAPRVGLGGTLFTMHKLRTMHCRADQGSSITAAADSRIFLAGRILRKLKIDELPQLINVLKGDMAVVGPRPEAPDIVERHYTASDRETLAVRPGLTSPGAIYNYTHGEVLLAEHDIDAEVLYVERILPEKMAMERDYLPRASVLTDIGVILQTVAVLVQKAAGRTRFPVPAPVARLHDRQGFRRAA
ncbi:MAG: sugar transferase [Planctomycetaceae bacterium]